MWQSKALQLIVHVQPIQVKKVEMGGIQLTGNEVLLCISWFLYLDVLQNDRVPPLNVFRWTVGEGGDTRRLPPSRTAACQQMTPTLNSGILFSSSSGRSEQKVFQLSCCRSVRGRATPPGPCSRPVAMPPHHPLLLQQVLK